MALDTLADLRTYAKRISDMENSDFVSDPEWNTYLQLGLTALYDVLVQKFEDYFVSKATITTVNQQDVYDLPADFYKILGVDLVLGNPGQRVTLRTFQLIDRNRFSMPNYASVVGFTNLRYRLRGNQLWLTPLPMGGQTLEVLYIPSLALPVADGDPTPEAIYGWAEYAAVYAAIKAREKQESDVSVLAAQIVALERRIESAANNRDAGAPQTTGDTMWKNYWGGSGGWSGAGGPTGLPI